MIRLCTSSTFSAVVASFLGISTIHNPPSSPSLLNSAAHFLRCCKTPPKVFYVVMNFLQGHALITEVLYDYSKCPFSQFNKPFPSVYSKKKFYWINSFESLFFLPKKLNKIKLSTNWGFISIYSFWEYQAEDCLIIPYIQPLYNSHLSIAKSFVFPKVAIVGRLQCISNVLYTEKLTH